MRSCISHLEHHANIVPWQQLAAQVGAKLKVIPVDDNGRLLLDAYTGLLTERTRLVAVSHVSNVLGTIVPVSEVIEAAHRAGATVLIDGAQAVAHIPVNVSALDADFYVLSGHKVFAPLGIGALYGKPELLEADAALAGRREHDRGRHAGADQVCPSRPPGSRRVPAALPTPWGSGPHWTTSAGIGVPAHRGATSTNCSGTPPGRSRACRASA